MKIPDELVSTSLKHNKQLWHRASIHIYRIISVWTLNIMVRFLIRNVERRSWNHAWKFNLLFFCYFYQIDDFTDEVSNWVQFLKLLGYVLFCFVFFSFIFKLYYVAYLIVYIFYYFLIIFLLLFIKKIFLFLF